MNVSFNLPSPQMDEKFLGAAVDAGLSGLAGHRTVGGIRASIYNAVTLAAVEKLVGFMEDFRQGCGR
jgi:phosphoserine aminotransferase